MASLCKPVAIAAARSAAIAVARSAAVRSKTVIPITASSRRTSLLSSRSIILALGTSVDSLMPLHSAIASSRLKSSIGADSSSWSCLSQGRALPL